MKVGIYLSNPYPETGGGYTFEQEVFNSLLDISQESTHQFVILSKQNIKDRIPKHLKKQIKTEVIFQKKISFPLLFLLLTRNFFPNSPIINRLNSNFSYLETCIKKNNISFMFFINPIHEIVDIPYISIVWDLQHRLQPWFPEVSIKGEWFKRNNAYIQMLQRSTYVITGTEIGRKEISSFYGVFKDNIKIFPHPTPSFVLNRKDICANNSTLQKFGIKKQYLIYPAQFWPHKNHANLLLALKKVIEINHLPLSLVFVGSDKENLAYIQNFTENLHLSEKVHFLGFISQEDLVDLYLNAFALVYPTFFGPENLPPLEAFALGIPVIASSVPGSEEQLGDAALLVNPKDPDEIAKAIATLYNDPILRNRLIGKGYARAYQWTGKDFMRGIFTLLDEFEKVRRCWK